MIEDLDEADNYVAGEKSDESSENEGDEATPWNVMKQNLLENNKKPKFDKDKFKEFQKVREGNYKKFIKEETLKKKKDAKWEEFSDGEENIEKVKTVSSTASITDVPEKKIKLEEVTLTAKYKKKLEKKQKLKERQKANRKLKLEAYHKAKEEQKPIEKSDTTGTTEVTDTVFELKQLSKKKKIKDRQKANRKLKREEHLKAINEAKQAKDKSDHGKASDDVKDEKIIKSPIKEVGASTKANKKNKNKKNIKKTINEAQKNDDVVPVQSNGVGDVTPSENENKNRKINKQKQKNKKNKINQKLNNIKNIISGADDVAMTDVTGANEEIVNKTNSKKPNENKNAEIGEAQEGGVKPDKAENVKEKGKFEKKNKNKKTLNNKQLNQNGSEAPNLINGNKHGDIYPKLPKRAEQSTPMESLKSKSEKCFACRQMGHMMRDCPQAGDTSICLKCGAADHTHTGCTVYSGPVYNFATCFKCRKKGHITSQCSMNKNGVYPDGGNCRYCASTEHLGKDCPDKKKVPPNFANKYNKNKKQSFGKKPVFNKNKK